MSTAIFKLLSGPECEIKEFTGKHQRILTEDESKNFQSKLDAAMIDVIIRIGNVYINNLSDKEKEILLLDMLDGDRKDILIQIRNLSLDNEPEVVFRYPYVDGNGVKRDHEVTVNLAEGFPRFPYYKTWNELGEIDKKVTVTLPKSQKVVQFTMLDMNGSKIGINTKKKDMSVHTPVLMRKPVYFKKEGDTSVPISLKLDDLPYKDLEFLKSEIKKHEGRIDSEWIFAHPETGKDVIVDILQQPAFFFPSEAM